MKQLLKNLLLGGDNWKDNLRIMLFFGGIFLSFLWFGETFPDLVYPIRQVALWFFATIGFAAFFGKNTPNEQKSGLFWLGTIAGIFAWMHYFGE